METSEASSPQADAIQAAIALRRAIERRMADSQVTEWISLELTMGQVKAMMALAREAAQGLNVSALAEALRVGKPAASILVDQLVQQGYAERTEDHDDRRRTLVALTPRARDLVERLRQGSYESFTRWLAALRADDLAALTRGLRALLAASEADGPVTSPARGDGGEVESVPASVTPHEASISGRHKRVASATDRRAEADAAASRAS